MPKPKKNEAKQDYLKRCTKEVMAEGKDADQAYKLCNIYWDEAKGKRQALALAAPLELEKPAEGKAKTFRMTAYTGQVIETWWGAKRIIDVAGMSAKAKIPVLREHQRDRVVGFSIKAWPEGKNFYLSGEFSQASKDGQEVLALAEEGFPWQASIGVWPRQVLMVKEKEEIEINGQKLTGPLEVWTKSLVGEVSFVALGADDETAAIVLSAENHAKSVPVEILGAKHKEADMPDITLTLLEQEAPDLLKEIRDAARAEGVSTGREEGIKTGREEGVKEGMAAERERAVKILSKAGLKGLSLELIQEGASYEAALEKMVDYRDQVKAESLKALGTQAPPALGQEPPKVEDYTEPAKDAPLEERAKQEWDKDAKLRQEFGVFETYLSYRRQEEAGLVKIIKK